jgi:hypothetical protein
MMIHMNYKGKNPPVRAERSTTEAFTLLLRGKLAVVNNPVCSNAEACINK